MKLRLAFCLLVFFSSNFLKAQAVDDSTTVQKNPKRLSILAVPLIYVSPESGFSFGAGGFVNYRSNPLDTITNPSNIRSYLLFSTKGNISADFGIEYYSFQNRRQVFANIVWKNQPELFFGIGNLENPYEEEFQLNLIDLEFSFYQQIEVITLGSKIYLGPRIGYKNFSITNLNLDAPINAENITGREGGNVIGLGLLLNYDSRDHIYYPKKGSWIELNNFFYQSFFGSDYEFTNFTLDARRYWGLGGEHVLAAQLYASTNFGNPPFTLMALLGGGKRLRGIYEGRFRDNHMVSMQAEYRFPMIWRFGAVLFGGIGRVAPEISAFNLDYWRPAGGAGIRFKFNKRENVHARLDIGYSKYDGLGFYATIKEAF